MIAPIFENCDFNHFADNTAANGAAFKGYSSSPDIARLVYSFHMRLAELKNRFEYADANITDDPTRDQFDR